MNVFLLGNGFDLHHKFPTAYIDFLKTINHLINLEDYSEIKTVYDVFCDKNLQSSCKNIKRCVEQHEEILKRVVLPQYQIEVFRENAKSNMWFQYLSKILNKDLGWIDFEKEIANVIEAFRYFFDNIGMMNQSVEDSRNIYIVSHFSFFLEIENDSYDDSAFWNVDEIKDEYKIEVPIGSGIYEIDKNKIVNSLYLLLEELQELLCEYLEFFVENILDEMRECGYVAKNPSYPKDVNCVITFNYTHTVEKISEINYNVIHMHGDVDNGIVLGVNPDEYDELGSIDTTFIKFKKYYHRINNVSDIGLRNTLEWIIDRKKNDYCNLYVVGHSLDVTDKDIIMQLFNLANKIIIFYHDKCSKGNYTENLIRMYGKDAYDAIREAKDIRYLQHAEINWSVEDDQL